MVGYSPKLRRAPSVRSPAELAASMQVVRKWLHLGPVELDFGLDPAMLGGAVVQSQ